MNIKSKLSDFKMQDDSRFINCKVRVCHDKDNKNNSWFDDEVQLRCAETSIRGIPLLAHVFKNEETGEYQLGGHDIDFEFINTSDGFDIELTHLEKPVGFVLQDSPIEQEIIGDRTYIVVYAVIWRNYADQLLGVLDNSNNEVDVSMEITVKDSYVKDDGMMVINNFDFEAITLLGCEPAMELASLSVFSTNMKSELESMMKIYSLEKGGEIMEKEDKVIEEVEEFEKETQEVIITEECTETIEVDGEIVEEMTKSTEVVEEIPCEPELEETEVGEFANLKEEYEKLKTSYAELETKINEMNEKYADYESLKSFKEEYDKAVYENQVEEVSKMFALDEDEVNELKEKALSKDISIEQFKEKLGLKFAMKQIAKKETKKEFSSEIQIINDVVEKENLPYGGVFEKYLIK